MTKRERKSSCDVRFGQISNLWSRYQDAWNENVGRRILSGGAVEVDWKKTLEQTGRQTKRLVGNKMIKDDQEWVK